MDLAYELKESNGAAKGRPHSFYESTDKRVSRDDWDSMGAFDVYLMHVVDKYGPLQRSDMVKILNKPRTTIYQHLSANTPNDRGRLTEKGYVKKFSVSKNSELYKEYLEKKRNWHYECLDTILRAQPF